MGKCVLLAIFILATVSCSTAFTPVDNYLVDCGSSTNTTVEGRNFVGDNPGSSFSVSTGENILGTTSSSPVSPVAGSALYRTARIFTRKSSYTFPIKSKGRHWVRLYFFPFTYQTYDLTTASFDVQTQDTVLLSNFRVQNTSSPVFKEYSVVVNSDSLVLSFVPLDNSVAFVNAIEVVSLPSGLISDDALTLNPLNSYKGLASVALETSFRLNMGGPVVSPATDSLQRTWASDQDFLLHKNAAINVTTSQILTYHTGGATPDTAPAIVYTTAEMMSPQNSATNLFNITWQFSLDFSYSYLVRMHFCDITSKALGQLIFNVYIGTSLAASDLDLSAQTQSLVTPRYFDFVLPATSGLGILTVSVGPSGVAAVSQNATLNGLEIMKFGMAPANPSSKGQKIGIIVGSLVGGIFLIGIIIIIILKCRAKQKGQHSWVPSYINGGHGTGSKVSNAIGSTLTSVQGTTVGYRFTLAELQEATKNFDEACVIGVGGFGKVYKGECKDGTIIAVKRANPGSQQGLKEFLTEIDTLSKFRHRHLVSLIGFCDEQSEMILVYEYMVNGTLKSRLYGSSLPSLSWKQRLEICIGAARGLHYLHTGSAQGIIHRDVKSANILLDENLLAKVSDFGLSKTGPDLDQTHVSTAVKGSFGYLDPEYFRRQQLTQKSDVYSFGVVLLEVLCARPAIDPSLPRERVNIVDWALKYQKKEQLAKVIDPCLVGTVDPRSLGKFLETILRCLAEYGSERPTIGDVLWNLEYALQLQESMLAEPSNDSENHIIDLSVPTSRVSPYETEMANRNVASDHLSAISASNVFSQFMNNEGR
ncbi:Receptor-like protein kinase [Nymphaea thermarum]|nr:Receptor-like protein kinase [Nymphaea thermarum]